MKNRLFVVVLFGVLFGLGVAVTAVVQAQSGDDPPVPPITEPESVPPVNWAQIQLPPHDLPPEPEAVLPVVPVPSNNQTAAAASPTAYVIQPGDTLFGIARRFQISVAALAAANGIVDYGRIYAGQSLQIPGQSTPQTPPAENVPGSGSYTVQPGDTLLRIARRFGVSLSALAAANGITNPSFIRVGQQLTIPGEAAPPPATPPPAAPPVEPPPAGETTYIVQRGDTLAQIARRFGVTIAALAAANHIANPALIYPGTPLIIPAQEAAPPPGPSPFIWPVESRRIVQFAHAGHVAIDIVTPTGSPVYAMADGTVEFAGWNQFGYGNLVVVDHGNGWRTLYAHNSAFQVKTGDTVGQGDVIALSGSTGNSTMPHVHLEMMLNFGAVDPCLHLPGGC